jgi:hypothetical protein
MVFRTVMPFGLGRGFEVHSAYSVSHCPTGKDSTSDRKHSIARRWAPRGLLGGKGRRRGYSLMQTTN